jgi:hypothetical protein
MAPAQEAAQKAMAAYFAGAIQAGMAGMGMAPGGGMAAAAPAAAPMLPRSPFDACQPPTLPQAFCPSPACQTHAQTPCFPCPTHNQVSVCLPCVTRQITQCIHCEPTFWHCKTQLITQCDILCGCDGGSFQPPVPFGGMAPPAGAGAQIVCALGTIHQSLQIVCSLATCVQECWVTRYLNTCNPECWITRYWTCNIECRLTRVPEVCAVASGVACPPPQSIACGSIGCGVGGPGGGQVEQAQFCIAGSVRPPQVTVACTIGGGCQSLPCPSWQYSCGWGCPPRSPQCPW